MSQKPNVLVYCANGLQGQAIIAQLQQAGFPVRAMVRDVSRTAHLRRLGVQVAQADFEAPDALREAHRGVDAVLLQLPAGEEPAHLRRYAEAALGAIAQAGIRAVIFNTGVRYPGRVAELPTFKARQALEKMVETSGLQWAIVRQTFLLQNLLLPWVIEGVQNGAIVYPVRADVELSWVAAEDVGRVAAAVLDRGIFGERFDLGADRLVNGDMLAEDFAAALGRPIRFVSLPLAEFERGVDAAVGSGAGKRVGAIFQFIERYPEDRAFVGTPYVPSPRLGGFAPTAIRDWVKLHRDAFLR